MAPPGLINGHGRAPQNYLAVKKLVHNGMMAKLMQRFLRDQSGATAIEYGLIAALIAVVIITVLTTIGTKLSTTFSTIASHI
jgi:pilus assembly protein Flp/PilA